MGTWAPGHRAPFLRFLAVQQRDLICEETEEEKKHPQREEDDGGVGKAVEDQVAVNAQGGAKQGKEEAAGEKDLQGVEEHDDAEKEQDGLGTVLEEFHRAGASLPLGDLDGEGADGIALFQEGQGGSGGKAEAVGHDVQHRKDQLPVEAPETGVEIGQFLLHQVLTDLADQFLASLAVPDLVGVHPPLADDHVEIVQHRHRLLQVRRVMLPVAVEGQDLAAGRLADTGLEGGAIAFVGFMPVHPHRVAGSDGCCIIGGAVVHHDHFVGTAKAALLHAFEQLPDAGGFVVGGYDDGIGGGAVLECVHLGLVLDCGRGFVSFQQQGLCLRIFLQDILPGELEPGGVGNAKVVKIEWFLIQAVAAHLLQPEMPVGFPVVVGRGFKDPGGAQLHFSSGLLRDLLQVHDHLLPCPVEFPVHVMGKVPMPEHIVNSNGSETSEQDGGGELQLPEFIQAEQQEEDHQGKGWCKEEGSAVGGVADLQQQVLEGYGEGHADADAQDQHEGFREGFEILPGKLVDK